MAQISFDPNKAYPSIPTVGTDLESHSRAIEAIREALQVHERRSKDVLNSFVRVQELADLGLIQLDGSIVEDITPIDEITTHHHNQTYIRLDGTLGPTSYIQFDTEYTDGSSEGKLQWNIDDGTLEFGLPGGQVNLQIGQEQVIRCRNTTGSQIDNGEVVYIIGASGNKPLIALADAALIETAHVLGIATENIAHNDNGFVNLSGLVRDVNTDGMTPGDELWLDSTPGGFTNVRPAPPNQTVAVGRVVVANVSAGVVLSHPDPSHRETDLDLLFVGTALDSPVVDVTSNGTVITLALDTAGGVDMRIVFSTGTLTLDCHPTPVTIALTPGTDISPTLNYVYVLESTGALAVSTTSWPSAEHAPIATVMCQSAASAQTDGLYKVHAWTDHVADANKGHLGHINYWIRSRPAGWTSGALALVTDGVGVFDLAVSSGEILQLHPHTWPAFDTSTGSEVMVVNDSVAAYVRSGDLTGITLDASGVSLSNKYFNVVVWGVISEDSGDCQVMINLPTDSYTLSASAETDVDGTAVYDIPTDYAGTGFLIARLTMRLQGSTYTEVLNTDLRGKFPSTTAGGGGAGGGGATTLVGLSDTDIDSASQYDLLFKAGAFWEDTDGNLQWNPSGAYLQLANNFAINWLDADTVSQEFLVLNTTGESIPGDLVVQIDFNDGSEGGTSAVNNGSADDPVFATNTSTTAASAFEGAFGCHIIGASNSAYRVEINEGAITTDAFGMNGNDFSVHFRYKLFEQAGSNYICEAKTDIGGDGDWSIQLDGFKRLEFRIDGVDLISDTDVLDADTWYHVAMTKSGDLIRLFKNGFLIGSYSSSSGDFPSADSVEVWLGRFHTMMIDSLVIVKNHAIWTDDFTPPALPGATQVQTFTVGDPAFATVIDGLTLDLTSDETDIHGTLHVFGAVDYDTTLDVLGAVTFVTTLNAQGAVDFDTTLNVDGAVTFVTTLNAQGAVDFDTTLNVDGVASFQDDLSLSAESAINIDDTEVMSLIPGVSGGDASWSSVVTLLDFNDADAVTVAIDAANPTWVSSFFATAQIDTAQSQFGTSSLLLDGNSDYVQFPNSTDLDFGSGDFTVEFAVRFNGDPGAGSHQFITKWLSSGSQQSYSCSITTNLLRLAYSTTGGNTVLGYDQSWNPAGDTWYHVAYVRSGGFIYHFVDGVQLGTEIAISATLFAATQPLTIGTIFAPGFLQGLNGWMDNVRITKGVGRYTENFTPPTEEYPVEDSDWASVVLLTNLDGADAATTYTSEDDGLRTATFVDNAQLDTAQFKFGVSSGLFDHATDEITFPTHVDFDFGTGDMTVELQVRMVDITDVNLIRWGSAVTGLIYVNASNKLVFWSQGSNRLVGTTSVVANTWSHVALVRDSGTFEMFLDGVTQGTVVLAQTYDQAVFSLGHGGPNAMDGWIDEVRVTKGVARYTANFTPPVAPFPVGPPVAVSGGLLVGDADSDTTLDGIAISVTGYFNPKLVTDAELNDVTDPINTSAGKIQGATVYNITQDAMATAKGEDDDSVWVDGAGATINTPV